MRLTTRTKCQLPAVTAILGVNDFFGELCLAGYPLRTSTAIALTASSIRTIKKAKMLEMLRKKNKTSNSLVAYLLSSVKSYQDHVAHLPLPSRTTARMRASAARTVGKERSTSYRAPHSQSPSSGGDGRDDSPANQFIHESIQETGIHKLRWGTGSASVVTKSSPKPLNISPKS